MLSFALMMAILGQPSTAYPPNPGCDVASACSTTIVHGQSHPSVQDGAILIGMGETMVVLLDDNGGNPQLIATGDEAAKRVLQPGELRFKLDAMGGAMLSIESKHGKWLNYRARMGLGGGAPTSVCTVMAGKSAFEMWQQSLKGLTLDQFTPAPEGQMVCR